MARVKPHAKIHVGMAFHHKTIGVYSDNDLLATYTRILLMAIERFAARDGDKFTASSDDIKRLTGKGRADSAMVSLRHLADISPISMRHLGDISETSAGHLGDIVEITVPNFSIKQGFKTKNCKELTTPEVTEVTEVTEVPSPAASGADPPPEPEEPGESGKGKAKRGREPPSSQSVSLAEYLRERVVAQWPTAGGKGAVIPKWAQQIDQIQIGHGELASVIDWLFDPEGNLAAGQFAIVVRCGKTLREKWQSGQIEAAMKRPRGNGQKRETRIDRIADEVRKSEERDHAREVSRETGNGRRQGTEARRIGDVTGDLLGR